MQNILVTGAAGFIGSHVTDRLIKRGDKVIGVDNLNDYYDIKLKKSRLNHFFSGEKNFEFVKADIADNKSMERIFSFYNIDRICHLAAQAGVRYSLENPFAYLKSNIDGTIDVFEMARKHSIKNVTYASSSSVYGGNKNFPFSVEDRVDMPVSLYAATKRSNELMAYTYHHLFDINMTGLRFFTVYGPWGRPDMALFKFTKNIIEGKPIDVYNFGNMKRDFTYIDDIVDGTVAAIDSDFEYEIFNLAYGSSVNLMDYIAAIEESLGKKAEMNMMGIQPGDVPKTSGDISYTKEKLGYEPKIPFDEGVRKFCEWYTDFYK